MTVVNPGGNADVPEIEDGLYQAVVKQVKDIILDEPDQFGNTEKVEIQIGFVDVDGEHQQLEPRVNLKWGERASLYAIAVACGCDCNPNEPFDTEDLVGKRVNVLVETLETGKWPRVKTWAKAGKAKAAQQTAPAAASASVLKPDGTLDTTAFWKETKRLGMTRESVAAAWDGDIENMIKADAVDVAAWLADVTDSVASNVERF